MEHKIKNFKKLFNISSSKFQVPSFKKWGFTLIESLVIIVIIGILASMGIPAFKNYRSALQLSGAVRELVTDLRYAQQLAVTQQLQHAVCFFPFDDGYKKEYQVIQYGECGVSEWIKKGMLEGVEINQVNFSNPEVIFNPYGAVKESGSIVLINVNTTKTIDIRPSGFVRIID